MSRQYFGDPYRSSHRSVPTQSYQSSMRPEPVHSFASAPHRGPVHSFASAPRFEPVHSFASAPRFEPVQSYLPSDGLSRRRIPATARDVPFHSTFQPIRERNPPLPAQQSYYGESSHSDRYPNSTRSSSNQTNVASNDRPRRRYRLESPSDHSRGRHSHMDQYDLPRSSDRHQYKQQQAVPTSSYAPASRSHRYDQDYSDYGRHSDRYNQTQPREETYPVQSYQSQPNHRVLTVPTVHSHPHSVRPSDRSFSPPAQTPMSMELQHPASLLTHLLQSLLGGRDSPANSGSDDDSSITPFDLLAFALMLDRPGVVHIQLGHLFGILADDEPPSVGLSDSDIQQIPTMIYQKSSRSKPTDDKCAICLSKYKTGESLKRLRCEHFFHSECIDPWLKTSVQCPICRGSQTG